MAANLAFTLAEACEVLEPKWTEPQLRAVIRALGWQPAGKRYTGKGGHPFDTWDMAQVMRLHAALVPFMIRDVTAGDEGSSLPVTGGVP
jgi:hypothetical protein